MIAAIIYANLSPFHIARLALADALGRTNGCRLAGIEISNAQRDYRWPEITEADNHCSHVTLFRNRDYWGVSYREMRSALHQTLNEIAPDVVFLPGWGFKESLIGLGWCLRRGVPRVVISDSQTIQSSPIAIKLRIKRFLVGRFQAGFAAGQASLRCLIELGLPPDRCFIGCDVVDNKYFAQEGCRRIKSLEKTVGAPTLLSCLRLLPIKNVPGVLEVLAEQAKEWSWIIAGDGPQRQAIEEKIRALGLAGRVKLLGHTDYSQLPRLYAHADGYLQPSLSDTWSLAVNEAMASGLPVIVSNRCGCHEDLVQEGANGFTFDPARAGDLGRALNFLLANRNRWPEMGRASQEIISHWDLGLFAESLWRAAEAAACVAKENRLRHALNRALGFAL